MDFLIGGMAGVVSAAVTNPLDVVRTRMQLQGELMKRSEYHRVYKNIPHALLMIVKKDGVRALYSGLVASAAFQLIGNGIRLGMYEQADRAGLLRDENHNTQFGSALATGGLGAIVGAGVGSPLLLVKTRQQARSHLAVGTQHTKRGTIHTFVHLYKSGGLRGLWRGTYGQMLRNSVGASMQMSSYAISKDMLEKYPYTSSKQLLSAFIASNVAAISKTLAMNPFDVIVTRLYNQRIDKSGHPMLYSGVVDCARKIARTEGLIAFYKGMWPSYMRQAPQSIILLVFWDIFKEIQRRLTGTDSKGTR